MNFFLAFAIIISMALGGNVSASEKEKNKTSSGGLKVKDYKKSTMGGDKKTSDSGGTQLTPEQLKLLQDSIKKGEKYLEERNKFLEELENEN